MTFKTTILLAAYGTMSAGMLAFLIVSIVQNEQSNETSTKDGAELFIPGCDVAFWADHRPLRWTVYYDAYPNVDIPPIVCPWKIGNTSFRCVVCACGLSIAAIAVASLHFKRNWLAWICCLMSIGISVAFFAVMITDSVSVNQSHSWCKSLVTNPEIHWEGTTPSGSTCDYSPFATVCGMDALAFVYWAVLAFFTFKHCRVWSDEAPASSTPATIGLQPIAGVQQHFVDP